MSRRVVVEVTAEDIAAGKKHWCERCPVAIALLRAAGTPRVHVDNDKMAAGSWKGVFPPAHLRFEAPDEVYDFMDAFDHDRHVAPFTFTVELP